MTKLKSILSSRALVIGLALVSSGGVSSAWAQNAGAAAGATTSTGTATDTAATPGPAKAQEIIVTGSRLGRSAFDSPTPLNVIDDKRLKELAIPSVADALNQLPAFRAITTPASDLFRSSSDISANTVDLRGLGSQRTLVLIDGRRVAPNTDADGVDLNSIPSAMIKSSEVVTGGASAQYGADAVAGVINLILDTKYVGFKTDISVGAMETGDDKKGKVAATWGGEFADGRLHIVAGAEFQADDGAKTCIAFDYCHRFTNFPGNAGFYGGSSHNGLPATLLLDNVLFVQNETGIITSVKTAGGATLSQQQQQKDTGVNLLPAFLQGKQFSADGQSLVPFQFGGNLNGLFMQGGDPSITDIWGYDPVPQIVANWHASTLEHVDYDINDNITLFGEFMYSRVHGGPANGANFGGQPANNTTGTAGVTAGLGFIDIFNNPYVSPAIRAQVSAYNATVLPAQAITGFVVNTVKLESGGQSVGNSDNDVYRILAGAKGHFWDNWNWDVSYSYGQTNSYLQIDRAATSALNGEAGIAVAPPGGYTGPIYQTPAGLPVICKSSIANPANGCQPVNYLGANSLTPAVQSKYYTSVWQTRDITEGTVSANLRTSLFKDYWAGPLLAAVGGEYRSDDAVGDIDPQTKSGTVFAAPLVTIQPDVARDVEEAYVATELPLLANLPMVKKLTVDLTGRYTHYSTAGDAKTWKAEAQWVVDDQLSFGVTKSADIRAPTPFESNPNFTIAPLPIQDPLIGAAHPINVYTGGNPNLKLEKAITKTASVVYKPNFVPGLQVSLTYYDIKIGNAIDSLTGPLILNACNLPPHLLCNLITAQNGGPSTFANLSTTGAKDVFANFQNLTKLQTRGEELVVDYTIEDVVGGTINLDLNANYVSLLQTIGGTGQKTELQGVTGNLGSLTTVLGVPQYKIDAVLTYSRPLWSASLHTRYIPESILDPTKRDPGQTGYNINNANSININHASPRLYFDLAGTLRPDMTVYGGKFEIYGAINNLFDLDPPRQLRFFGNPLHYDPLGRFLTLGIRTNW